MGLCFSSFVVSSAGKIQVLEPNSDLSQYGSECVFLSLLQFYSVLIAISELAGRTPRGSDELPLYCIETSFFPYNYRVNK